jgi:hypothetical protein
MVSEAELVVVRPDFHVVPFLVIEHVVLVMVQEIVEFAPT